MKTLAGLALLALACGGPLTRPAPIGTELRVTGSLVYLTLDNVPRPLADLVTGMVGPIYFAVSNGQVCQVDAEAYTQLVRDQRLDCRWRYPHGT